MCYNLITSSLGRVDTGNSFSYASLSQGEPKLVLKGILGWGEQSIMNHDIPSGSRFKDHPL
jgi:hypothetical protein